MSRSTIRTLVLLNAFSLALVAGLVVVVVLLLRRPPPPPVQIPVPIPMAAAGGDPEAVPYRDRWEYVDGRTGERREGVIDDDGPLLERFIADVKLDPGQVAALRDRLAARRASDAKMAALMAREGRWNKVDFILSKRTFWNEIERILPPEAITKLPPDYRRSGESTATTTTTTANPVP